jgi:hypothetical protein
MRFKRTIARRGGELLAFERRLAAPLNASLPMSVRFAEPGPRNSDT